ncbi:helix-turn-helix domain-containing protein [Paenibacillus larvae]|nr:helix-turn-helix domain-containing protein [Paenibacillus larvae]
MRTTTYDERVEIVRFCIEHQHNYAQTADKFQVSYQQVYSWTNKYLTSGVMHFRQTRERKSEDEMSEVEKLRAQNKLLQAENRRKQMEIGFAKKAGRDRKEAVLSQVRYETIYLAIREFHETKSYPICQLCILLGSNVHQAIYKWINRKESMNEIFNKALLPMIKDAYEEKDGILGYRQMTIKLNRERHLTVNHKRIYYDLSGHPRP